MKFDFKKSLVVVFCFLEQATSRNQLNWCSISLTVNISTIEACNSFFSFNVLVLSEVINCSAYSM